MRVVATAGHVDHGKSTLVRALTGMEPDRYEEERRRGLTIDLGFVWTTLPSGRGVAFVDVPGHARLVRTMLAGVGAVDRCLFVVAANEGWMPQTEEHLRILDLVGAVDGVVALTKVDAVDAADRAAARAALSGRLRGTFLEGRPVVEVDALRGEGLPALRVALDELIERAPPPPSRDRPRLWVDRAFTVRGAGTVVTGTLSDGPLDVGDELVALDTRSRPVATRVRALQSQERDRSSVGPGQRVAVNVAGVPHDALGRGAVVVRPGQWRPTARFDARLRTLPGAELGNRGALLGYVGTSEQPVRLRLLEGRERIGPGEAGAARVWLTRAAPLLPGDRFVLRDTGRGVTVAGGEVLDVHPVLPVSRARPDRSVDRLVAERGWVEADELEAVTGVVTLPTVGRWVVSPAALDEAHRRVEAIVGAAGPLGADVASLDERLRALVATDEGLVVDRGRVRPAGGPEPPASAHPWLLALEAAPFAPPAPDDVPRAEVRALVQRGLVVEEAGLFFALAAVEEGRRRVAAALAARPEGLAVGDLRELLGSSRKYVVPLATILDRRGVTVRRGDRRLPGRRLDLPLEPRPI
ncbi:MAG: selenocysteine-specific translation elongation factor [Acidimicrobiia bacterium]